MNIKSQFFNLGNLNRSLHLSQKLSVSVSQPINIDVSKTMIDDLIINELSQSFQNKILKEISSYNEDFLDVMNLSDSDSINVLHNYLCRNNYDFIIFCGQIGMLAQDSVLFTTSPIGHQNQNKLNNNDTFYHLGKLGKIDCYIDAFKRWNDKEIICGRNNSFHYNCLVGERKLVNSYTFAPKLVIDLDYDFIVNKDSFLKLHFVNEYNSKYVQINRDKKLDELLYDCSRK